MRRFSLAALVALAAAGAAFAADPLPRDAFGVVAAERLTKSDFAGPPAVTWRDVRAAMDRAEMTGRVCVILVTSPPNCPPCRQLEAGALKDAGVVADLAGCSCGHIDGFAPENRKWLDAVGVSTVPTIIVLDDKLVERGRLTGNVSAADIRALVKAARSPQPQPQTPAAAPPAAVYGYAPQAFPFPAFRACTTSG